jgi:hypothetical protein
MRHSRVSPPRSLAPDERAFFVKLAAMNAAFEAARAGEAARPLAARADAIDDMLNRYFLALTAPETVPPRIL